MERRKSLLIFERDEESRGNIIMEEDDMIQEIPKAVCMKDKSSLMEQSRRTGKYSNIRKAEPVNVKFLTRDSSLAVLKHANKLKKIWKTW